MKWIPRNLNYRADLLSRTIDFDDYTKNDDVFLMLDCKWGPHTVDRFACSFRVTILYFTSLAPKSWTLSLKTGNAKIIGFFHRSRKLVLLLT